MGQKYGSMLVRVRCDGAVRVWVSGEARGGGRVGAGKCVESALKSGQRCVAVEAEDDRVWGGGDRVHAVSSLEDI